MNIRLAAFLVTLSAPAIARDDLRELCTTRPSLGTSACTVDRGHVVVELGLLDWERDTQRDTRSTRRVVGDTVVRVGLSETSEVQVGLETFARMTELDRATGSRQRSAGPGNLMLAFRQNLANPDGSGLSVGFQPFARFPLRKGPADTGDWEAGLTGAVSYEISNNLTWVLNPELDDAPDSDEKGHHWSYGSVAGLEMSVSSTVAFTMEASAFRDLDPSAHITELLGAFSATYRPSANLQFDAGIVTGLNRQSPDLRLLTGISTRF